MLFKDIHANPDYAPVRYKADDFPSFCAEMGAGIQTVYWSRPICTARAAEALMVRTLGSGCNGIGYYMYHGGSTPPRGDLNAFSSDEAVAVPKISYDFQAPVGEFGLEGVSYRNLRLIHSFLDLYQDRLAPMETVLPEGYEKITPDNRDDLRWAVRMKDGSGFVFMVNFQDHDYSRHDQSGTLRINLEKETISIPFTLAVDESLILPFNLDMDGARLRYATAQPLTRVTDGGAPHYIFFAPEGMQPEFVFAGGRKFRPSPGFDGTFTYRGVKVTCLTRSQALDACKVNGRLIITKTTVLPGPDDSVTLLSLGESEVEYTFLNRGKFITATASVGPVTPEYTFDRRTTRHASLRFRYPEDEHCVQEYFLRIPYTADVAMAFMDGVLCQDEFWQGRPWTIGLKRYAERLRSQDMTFYFRPLADMPFLHRDLPEEVLPDFSNGPVCEIGQVEVIPQYLIELKLSNP